MWTVILLPLIAAIMIATGGSAARLAWKTVPWLPLFLLWPLMVGGYHEPRWLLFGFALDVDEVTAAFTILVAFAWSMTGWQAVRDINHEHQAFWIGWLLCLSGMTLAVFSANLVGFYLGYVVLSLSAWLMIVQTRSDEAWRAARIYLVMALMGEAAILAGILILAGHYGNFELGLLAGDEIETPHAIARWLLLAGFAVKLGIVPLHMWLPLAHPVAPVPASAILSGIIVKAGLLGWLRLVPRTGLESETTGQILLAIGLFTAFAGVLLGLTQGRLKTVLAYSTISQMGLVLVGFSLVFLIHESDIALLSIAGLLLLHHGFNKAALFLACGNSPGASRLRLLLFLLPALALAAAPMTTGFLVKHWIKQATSIADIAGPAYYLLTLTSAMTAMLMWKAWILARQDDDANARIHPAWPTLVTLGILGPWTWAILTGLNISPAPTNLWDSTWPLLIAVTIIAAHQQWQPLRLKLPEGDAVVLFERLVHALHRPLPALPANTLGRRVVRRSLIRSDAVDRYLRELPLAGMAILLVGAILWVLVLLELSLS